MFYFLNLYSNREYSRKKTIVFNSLNSFNSFNSLNSFNSSRGKIYPLAPCSLLLTTKEAELPKVELFFIKVPTGTVEAVCTNSLLW